MGQPTEWWNIPTVRAAHAFADGWDLWEGTYEASQWDGEAIESLRRRRLGDVLSFARGHVPAYADLPPGADDEYAWLQELPFMDKETLQRDPELYLADEFDRRSVFRTWTSGTTGQPASFVHDRSRWVESIAGTLRIYSAYELPFSARLLRFTTLGDQPLVSTEIDAGFSFAPKLSINLPALRDIEAAHVNALIREFRPQVMWGQPVDLLGLCRELRAGRIELPGGLRVAFSHGDLLTEEMRAVVSEMIGARVVDLYGNQEFGRLAWSCPEAPEAFHVDDERLVIEIIEQRGGDGELVISGLTNKAMPLLRYRTGDAARLLEEQCKCGRALHRLSGMRGRERGFLQDSDGSLINSMGVLDAMAKMGLARWRVHQVEPGILEVLAVPFESQGLSDETRAHIADALRSLLTLHDVRVREAELAELTSSGGKAVLFSGLVSKDEVLQELR